LTLLAVRALQFGQARLKRWSLPGAALLGVLYAGSDEIHQIFVPTRGPSFTDVLIDSIGIALALAGVALWFALKSLERRLWRANALSASQPADSAEPDYRPERIQTG
jgi:VanZ family protein